MSALKGEFVRLGHRVQYVHDSAVDALELGFPILWDHTFESTAWLMARAIQLEMEATLDADVILVDRPVHDALGYLLAALVHTDRTVPERKMRRLERFCTAWAGEYDLVFMTVLDPQIQLGEGRDGDAVFRQLAGEKVAEIVDRFLPDRRLLRSGDRQSAVKQSVAAFTARNEA